jgi:hypothetical protein
VTTPQHRKTFQFPLKVQALGEMEPALKWSQHENGVNIKMESALNGVSIEMETALTWSQH